MLSKPQLLEVIVQSIYDCGWQVLYLNQSHPFELKIFNNENITAIYWVYIKGIGGTLMYFQGLIIRSIKPQNTHPPLR